LRPAEFIDIRLLIADRQLPINAGKIARVKEAAQNRTLRNPLSNGWFG
jgi:hypothetical protein